MMMIRRNPANYSTFSSVVDSIFNHQLENIRRSDSFQVAVNVAENENGYLLEVIAPGRKKEDFEIEIKKDTLVISSSKKEENIEENESNGLKFTRKEYTFSAFSRSFRLPETADNAQIRAKYEDGVLRVAIPKQKVLAPSSQLIAIE